MRKYLILAGIAGIAASAHADFINGSFETGDFTGWDVQNASQGSFLFVYPSSDAPDGNDWAAFGAVDGIPDTISQTLSTNVGQNYLLTFYLGSSGDDVGTSHPRGFQVTWDNITLYDGPAPGPSDGGIQLFTYEVQGTGSDTASFAGYNFWSNTNLDDVHLTALPAPEPLSCLALTAGVAALIRRRKAK